MMTDSASPQSQRRRAPALILTLAAVVLALVAAGLLTRTTPDDPLVLAFAALPVLVGGLAAALATSHRRSARVVQAAATVTLATFVALAPLAVSLAQTDAGASRGWTVGGLALVLAASLALCGVAFARPALLTPESSLWLRLRERRWARLLAAGLIVAFWAWLWQFAALLHLRVAPFALIPLYGWGAALGIGELWLVERERRSWAFYVALGIAAACVIRDTALSSTYYFLYETDAWGYFRYARFMFDPSVADMPISRTLNYPLVINLLLFPFNSALPANADSLWRVVHFQIVVAAFATGLLVYVIGLRDRTLALAAGLFLALEVVWGAYQRWIFTESLTMSFLVISLAVMIRHFRRADRLRWPELLLAGVLFGWTVTLRASNLYFAVAIVFIYLVFTRSLRKSALVGVGVGLFIVAASLFNLWRFDAFRMSGQQGFFFGWPALGYHLYSPDDGPESARFAAEIAACRPNLDLTTIPADQVNFVIWQGIIPCYDSDLDVVTARFSAIFAEAFRQRPLDYVGTVLREQMMLLAYPMRATTGFSLQTTVEMFRDPLRAPTCTDTADSWCGERPYPRDPNNPLLAGFANATTFLVQPYLLLAPPGPLPPGRTEELYRYLNPPLTQPPSPVVATIAWFAMLGYTVFATRGLRRFVVLVSAALIHYVLLVVTAAMVYDVLNTRLLTALTPFFALVSAVFFVTVVAQVRGWWRRAQT